MIHLQKEHLVKQLSGSYPSLGGASVSWWADMVHRLLVCAAPVMRSSQGLPQTWRMLRCDLGPTLGPHCSPHPISLIPLHRPERVAPTCVIPATPAHSPESYHPPDSHGQPDPSTFSACYIQDTGDPKRPAHSNKQEPGLGPNRSCL